MSSPQQHQQLHTIPPGLTNIDPALEGVVKNFMRSEKYARKIKYIVRATSVPGRQNYKFAPATALTPQETKIWRTNLVQDEIASNNPFWTARWMRVFGTAPRLDDSLLKVPWIKCERPGVNEGDPKATMPLHRKETYLDLRDEQNRNWAMDSFAEGIAFAQKGQLDDAIKAYSQSIQIDSKCIEGYIARGCTLANMKKFRAAIMDFRAALGLDPTNISARQYLETTIAQEEEHRLNPVVDMNTQRAPLNKRAAPTAATTTNDAFDPNSNLDNINEIVLDTDNFDMANCVSERVISPETATEVVTGATIEVEIGAVTEVETGTGVVIEAVIEAEIRVVTGAGKGAGKGAGIEVVIVIDTLGGHDEGVKITISLKVHQQVSSPSPIEESVEEPFSTAVHFQIGKQQETVSIAHTLTIKVSISLCFKATFSWRVSVPSRTSTTSAHSPHQKQDGEDRGKDQVKDQQRKEKDLEAQSTSSAKEAAKDTPSQPRELESATAATETKASVPAVVDGPSGKDKDKDKDKDKPAEVRTMDEKDTRETASAARSTSKDRSDDKKAQDSITKASESSETTKTNKDKDRDNKSRPSESLGSPAGTTNDHVKPTRMKAGDGAETKTGLQVPQRGEPVVTEDLNFTVGRGVEVGLEILVVGGVDQLAKTEMAVVTAEEERGVIHEIVIGTEIGEGDDAKNGGRGSSKASRSRSPLPSRSSNNDRSGGRDRSRSGSRSRREGGQTRTRSRSPVKRARDNNNNSRRGRSDSKGQGLQRKRTKSGSPARSGGGGGGGGGGGKGGKRGGGKNLSGANTIEVSKDFMEQRKKMRMRQDSPSRSRSR
ncbi:hypothetical protein BGZ97_002397 [Linnemannia gamsii]|uniref:TPR-like protein n=1 Tax=Linnemannia gamsii TaxID=64522 RepID=A0A9P6QYV3_9FUNG|nr:hypothetical protein BGZ97_002397 [Linnemannia gamsii]